MNEREIKYSTLIFDENNRSNRVIGCGDEGIIYKYNTYAIKIFDLCNQEELMNKIVKVKLMCNLKDESFAFPLGIVLSLNNKNGYYMNIISKNKKIIDLSLASYKCSQEKLAEYIVKASVAMERIHNEGIIIGDIKEDNILIDKNDNPVYIDTDNFEYLGYDCSSDTVRTNWLKCVYPNRIFSKQDNDKFVFGIMALQLLAKGVVLENNLNKNYYDKVIELLDVNKEVKDGLKMIFSDANDKPYIGSIIERIDFNKPLLTPESFSKINRIKKH